MSVEGPELVDLGDLGWDDDPVAPPEPVPKVVKRQPSMLFDEPEVDLRVPSHARYIADVDGEIRDVVQKLSKPKYVPIYPDDMPWGDPSLEIVKDVFHKILTSGFQPIHTSIKKGRTEKAIEMPLRASYYQSKHLYDDPNVHLVVLDVTMGKELLYMFQANNNQRLRCHVHMVMRGARPKTMVRVNWWKGCVYEGFLHLHAHDVLPTVDEDGNRLEFDRVYCDLSVGYWLSTEHQKRNLFNWLDGHLTPTGEFLGSYVNPDSVKHFEVKARGHESGLGLVEFRDARVGWDHGTVLVRVDQKVFEDGRIPYDEVLAECGKRGFSLGTPGLKFMEKYGLWTVPARFKRWVRSAEVSCVDLLYIRRPKMILCSPLPVASSWQPVSSVLPREGVALHQGGTRAGGWSFPMNHGKILGPGDVYFFHPEDQLMAYKQDGRAGKLIIVDSVARILITHRAGDTVHECAVEFSGSILAQVEVKVNEYDGSIEQVWVLDVFDCPGVTESDDFESRYRTGWDLIRQFRLPKVRKQEWRPYSPEAFEAMVLMCGRDAGMHEGVVFQSRRAPRGCFTNFLGSARYWKPRDRLTVDRAVGNRVFEYYLLDGVEVRERIDKKVGNTPGQVAELESCLQAEEIIALLDRSSHSAAVAEAVVDSIEAETLDLSPDVAIALLHPNRSLDTVYVEMLNRGLVTTEMEASHVLARYSGVIESLSSEANITFVRASTRIKWYDPDRYKAATAVRNITLKELEYDDGFNLPVFD